MIETNEPKSNDMLSERESDFKSIQKQLLVNLTQELGSDIEPKKLCKSVAKMEKIGNKINDICIQSFNKNFERIVDEMENEIKSNELIHKNNLNDNQIIDETIETIIDKQIEIEKMNESIVEKSLDLISIKSEDIRSELMKQVVNENEISFETIKSQLKTNQKI